MCLNILVVEDDKNLKKLMVTCLKKNGYKTTIEASNGEEALEVIEKNYIDLVITDIMMPKINGYELIKKLRQCKYNIQILLVTAKSEYQDKECLGALINKGDKLPDNDITFKKVIERGEKVRI